MKLNGSSTNYIYMTLKESNAWTLISYLQILAMDTKPSTIQKEERVLRNQFTMIK